MLVPVLCISVAANAWFLYKRYRDSKLIKELEAKVDELFNK